MDGYYEPSNSRGRADFGPAMDADLTPMRDGSLSSKQLWRFLYEIRDEPDWRTEAEVDNAYYDGDQLTQATLRKMRDNGILPIVMNMIAPAIDAMCGLEIINRADFMVVPETEESYESATALNVKFKEAHRLTKFNSKISTTFKGTLKQGLSWIEVGRNPDPFEYPYRVGNPAWREMYVDYKSRDIDYSDKRYMVRRKWYDEDELIQYFPDPNHRQIIKYSKGGFRSGWMEQWDELGYSDIANSLSSHHNQEQRRTLDEDEWRRQHRGRVALYEILYYVPKTIECLRMNNGMVIELDRKSATHYQALSQGIAQYQKGVTRQWRQAYYVGPEQLSDHALAMNRPHYIPMVAYRKDNDGTPYGFVRRQRSPQENVNARYSRILYDLSSRQFSVDDDATDNPQQLAKELNKVNSLIVLKGDRRGEQGLSRLTGTETSAFTFQMLQEAKQNIYDVTGIYPEFLGQSTSSGQSGVAIEQLLEQTTKVLGIVLDNYKQAKIEAAQYLLGMIVKDIEHMNDVEIELDEDNAGQRKKVMINARQANGARKNDLLMAKMKVTLSDVPASATYQQQKFKSLVEIVKSMPEEMQVVMMDLIVRAAALPNAEEILERIRSITGYGPEPKDPEKRAQLQKQAQDQQALQEKMQEIDLMMQESEAQLTKAKAITEQVKAEKLQGADTELTEAKTLGEIADASLAEAEQQRKNTETQANLIDKTAHLRKESRTEKEKKEKPAKK